MGNSCRRASSMEWAGEDWGSLTSKNKRRMSTRKVFDEGHGGLDLGSVEKEKLLGALRASSDIVDGKVKIKISKKELVELLGGTDMKKKQARGGVSAEQVLVGLINARDHVNHDHAHHRPWRPVLQSIPEVN